MAYEANRRHKDCIALYKELESSHPMINIRRQAAELRYILEAPKLKISNDEVVTIPQIGSSWDWLVIYFRLCSFPSPSLCHFALEFTFCVGGHKFVVALYCSTQILKKFFMFTITLREGTLPMAKSQINMKL